MLKCLNKNNYILLTRLLDFIETGNLPN